MDSRERASMTALILTGVSKDRAASRWGHDPEFSETWDRYEAGIERQRQENPNIQFALPNEMPDLDDGAAEPAAPAKPAAPSAPKDDAASEPTDEPVPDGPAIANLKKKAAPPK